MNMDAKTRPMAVVPRVQDIRLGKSGLSHVRNWLGYLDIGIMGEMVSASRPGNYKLFDHTPGFPEHCEFGRAITEDGRFQNNGLPKTLTEDYTRTVLRLCQQTDTPSTYKESLRHGLSGYQLLGMRVDGGILVAEAKLQTPELQGELTKAIKLNQTERLAELLRNQQQEDSVRTRAREHARELGVQDETFIPLYQGIIQATLAKEISHLMSLRQELA
jgi:chorismate mutase